MVQIQLTEINIMSQFFSSNSVTLELLLQITFDNISSPAWYGRIYLEPIPVRD